MHFQNLRLQLFAQYVTDSENSLLTMVPRAAACLALIPRRVRLLQLLDHSSKIWPTTGFTATSTAYRIISSINETITGGNLAKTRALVVSHARSGPN